MSVLDRALKVAASAILALFLVGSIIGPFWRDDFWKDLEGFDGGPVRVGPGSPEPRQEGLLCGKPEFRW